MDEETIPKARLDAEIAKRKAAEEQIGALQAQLTEAQATAASAAKEAEQAKSHIERASKLEADLESLRGELDKTRAQGQAHAAMLEAGVTDASVRDYMLHVHSQQPEGEAKEWGDWWESQIKEPPGVLRPYVRTGEGEDRAAGGPPPPAPPAPGSGSGNRGAAPPPKPPSEIAPGSVAKMSREEFAARKADLIASVKGAALF